MALTVTQMTNELWEMLGEPSDLDPGTAPGLAKLLLWLNEAQRRVATYIFPTDNHILRFPVLYDVINHKAVVKTGTLAGGSSDTIIFDAADTQIGATSGQYVDWLVEITAGTGIGQTRLIMTYDGATKTATVEPAWDTTPDGSSTYQIFKRFVTVVDPTASFASENLMVDPRKTMVYPLRIDDITNKRPVEHGEGKDSTFLLTIDQAGIPTEWIYYGNKIIFNYAPSDPIWYRIEYYRKPVDMMVVTDTPEIPDEWHTGIILGARWWGFCRGQEAGMGYSAKRDFDDFMRAIRQQSAMGYERLETGVIVEVE